MIERINLIFDREGQEYFDFPEQSISVDSITRVCWACGKSMPLRLFCKKHNRKHGYAYLCRECHSKRQRQRLSNPKECLKQLCRVAKSRAQKKNFEYSLDPEILYSMAKKTGFKCEITGIELDFKQGQGGWKPNSPSVDRIDNSLGYTMSNIRLVCWEFNRLKGELQDNMFDIKEMAKIVKRRVFEYQSNMF
jgi:hypothetical protein